MIKGNFSRITYILRQMNIKIKLITERLLRRILPRLMSYKSRPGMSGAGFVLPTVTMVMLVVLLLTIAISLRSFNRVQDARNVRVNQAVLSAATPALDRAKAKLEELLVTNPPTTDTPTDDALYLELTTTVGGDKYTFGDEQRLQVAYKVQGNSIEEGGEDGDISTIEDNEIVRTVWRFPVDTDNNGSYDSFTIYAIFFRTPERTNDGSFAWARTPLDARTPPMESGAAGSSPQCQAIAGTSSILVGDSGWYKSGAQLKKSFFTYTTTVPITDLSVVTGNYDVQDFETFKGTVAYSALEYQQDWSRVPLTNNAVVYEDDLEIAPGPDFRLNGRIQANSNLIISSTANNNIDLYLVSSPKSCFIEDEENSKIVVGGNVVNGLVERDGEATDVKVHLQTIENQEIKVVRDKNGDDVQIDDTHESVSDEARLAAYNSQATQRRINSLVDAQMDNNSTSDPTEVQTKVENSTNPEQTRRNALATYFKKWVRKVPFIEVNEGEEEDLTGTLITGTGDDLKPSTTSWMEITDIALNLNPNELEASDPSELEDRVQNFVGDRVLVGNNLPQNADPEDVAGGTWADGGQRTRQPRVATIADVGSTDRDGFWEDAAATAPEAALDGIGGLRVITGAGVYERTKSFLPPPPENPDGFPVVWPDTMPMSPDPNSRVYDNEAGVWPPEVYADVDKTVTATDSIDPDTEKYAKGDLRMRATAVYHYAQDFINSDDSSQDPIACISSYYDPSTSSTARNLSAPIDLADVSGTEFPIYTSNQPFLYRTGDGNNDGNSNNGIVYGPPAARPDAANYNNTTEQFSGTGLLGLLANQANMVFPNGRFVNEKLRDALQKSDADRSLSEQAAVDTTMCSLGILGNAEVTLGTAPSYIDDGAIKEVSFLDARQIQASDPDNDTTEDIDETFTIFDLDTDLSDTDKQTAELTTNNNLSLEERQPLEIRATQLDLDRLRQAEFTPSTSVGPRRNGKEYLLPLSGIIYASRDDALPDRSDPNSTSNDDLGDSPYDYKLDPTRRPNAIMLINGQRLDRPAPGTMTTEEVIKEKGLTLVSNLPVYIQGNFNLHQNGSDDKIEEFTEDLVDQDGNIDWGRFYDRGVGKDPTNFDPNFACRALDPKLTECTDGDQWRPVNILADGLSLLSDQWRPGFRNEGDFDLRNNAGNLRYNGAGNPALIATGTEKTSRLQNGFFANNYATNGLSSGADFEVDGVSVDHTDNDYRRHQNDPVYSSYFTNFVTPVQRRVNQFPEYVMEVCFKLPVYACEPDDWVIPGITTLPGGDNIIDDTTTERTIADIYSAIPADEVSFDDVDPGETRQNIPSVVDNLASGTTASAPDLVQRFPRRIAFLRNQGRELIRDGSGRPVPIGVFDEDNIQTYPYTDPPYTYPNNLPRLQDNVLLFRTTSDISDPSEIGNATYTANPLFYLAYNDTDFQEHPGLVPVLQIHEPDAQNPGQVNLNGNATNNSAWMARATNTTFNLVSAAADTPSRPGQGNGGLQNFVRFQENWKSPDEQTVNISGAFIQLGRSKYSTAGQQQLKRADINANDTSDLFGYRQYYYSGAAAGILGFQAPPNRQWGFDVGLLSQSPDLFAQKFSNPSSGNRPDEYYREVGRDDPWITALLCAEDLGGTDITSRSGVDCSNYDD
ncbi:hormogonium polysaccharide biosynthesis protein HpsA [Dapis sp. BLCC M229]|uniref:hormogonium polysaccharide biosynthesis protein HpsA n=1 Tax=Dapis sp. BLCC M229 TaxID=3400188 RepID=UPI003CE6F7AC